jgi:hypothetical protein
MRCFFACGNGRHICSSTAYTWGGGRRKREKFGISMEENGVFVEKRWKIMDETYGKKWQILLN